MEVMNFSPPYLPDEILRMVFRFLPNSILTNVRLTSKRWSAIAATFLWRELTVNLLDNDTRKVEAILNSNPGGILDNVKELYIATCVDELNNSLHTQARSNLHALLSTLPRDCLTKFSSDDYCLKKNDMSMLLRAQTQLNSLAATLSDSCPGTNNIRGTISRLQHLRVRVTKYQHSTYQNYSLWFAHASQLRALCIEGPPSLGTTNFRAWSMTERMPLLRLHTLELKTLQNLTIKFCLDTPPLLQSLSEALKKTANVSLRYFSLEVFEHITTIAEELLRAARGLRQLNLYITMGNLPELSCLHECGESLQVIFIHHLGAQPYYAPEDLELLVDLCSELCDVSVCLINLDDAIENLDTLETLHLSALIDDGIAHHEYAKSVQVLARLPKLKVLRLGHNPWLSSIDNTYARRWRHAQIADEIMNILGRRVSPTFVLLLSPNSWSDDGDDDGTEDENEDGHVWPDYFYKKGEVFITGDYQKKTIRYIAVPCSEPDVD